ncbi:class I SAM-dependent methyltransferase [Haliea sp. E17]
MPLFQNRVYASPEDAVSCPRGDVVLVECQETGLVFNAAFQPEAMVYDAEYQNEQALSPAFRAHLEFVKDLTKRKMGKSSLVEIGCGKAYFLEMLQQVGFGVRGYDPTYEGDNPLVSKRNFTAADGAGASGFILRHVLEHIASPYQFLRELRDSVSKPTRIYIEVPCFDWIIRHGAWFDIFYEHVNYFRLSDFHRMFGTVIDSGVSFGGQYLYVVADLTSLRPPVFDVADSVEIPASFSSWKSRPEFDASGSAIVWGGSSKGVIFSLLMQRLGRKIQFVVDINPEKQGKYLPASGLPVVSPETMLMSVEKGSTVFVMNTNYLEEIKMMSSGAFRYVGVDCG